MVGGFFGFLTGAPTKSDALRDAEAAFTTEELTQLQQQWREALTRAAAHSHHGATSTPPSTTAAALQRSLPAQHVGLLLGALWPCLDPLLASQLLRLLAGPQQREHRGAHDSRGGSSGGGGGGGGAVSWEGFLAAKARLERQGEETALEFTYSLLDVYGDGAVRHAALEAAVTSCMRIALAAAAVPVPAGGGAGGAALTAASGGAASSGASSSSLAPWATHVGAMVRGALLAELEAAGPSGRADGGAPSPGDVSAVRLSYNGYRRWAKRCPALHKSLCTLLEAPHGGGGNNWGTSSRHTPLVLPALVQLGKLTAASTLLQPVWTWALASRLPPAQRSEWRLLFSSQRDGKSFNTFIGRVAAVPGPTLLLIRDKGGAVFGGYASQPWAKSGTFFGDVSSAVFTLEPALQVFPATGINDNYQWCGVGFTQLPGGLGFGGAASGGGHFALYVEPSLDAGMSRPIATYGNTASLASAQLFQIDTLECWLLQPPEEEPGTTGSGDASGSVLAGRRGGGGSNSVLATKATERSFMELAGLKLHSGGLKDEPLEET